MTSRPNKKLHIPLKNLTNSLNRRSMSFSGDSGFSNLTNSPMSTLAFNLSELSTGRSTPRRRLSLSSVDTPPSVCDKVNPENSQSAESGCFTDSPDFFESPTLERKKTIAFRRIHSQPLPSLRLDSPTDFADDDCDENDENQGCSGTDLFADDAASQDSGLGLDSDRRGSVSSFDDGASSTSSSSPGPMEKLPSLEDVWNSMSSTRFKAPRGKPPKRTRSMVEHKQLSEDTCSPHKYSPVKASSEDHSAFTGFSKALFSISPTQVEPQKQESKPVLRLKKQISASDDGFQELFDIEDVSESQSPDGSATCSSLLSAAILHSVPPTLTTTEGESEDQVPEMGTVRPLWARRGSAAVDGQDNTPSSRPVICRRPFLLRSQSVDIQPPRLSFKRSEPPQDGTTPIQSKKWRGDDSGPSCTTQGTSEFKLSMPVLHSARRLHRCHSETEATIKSAVSRMFSEPDLIGDTSKPYCLPTIKGKHQDLKAITPETLSRVLTNEFQDDIEEFHILDCRYPYEFTGGHIQGALNLYTRKDIDNKYLESPLNLKDSNKRMVLIFHCEFSSERGPGLSRYLRKKDRESNKECYPFLHYPEIYLLEGGYKRFYEEFPHLCEPQTYLTMLDKNYSEDLRKFRAECKSFSDERSQHRAGLRTIKF